VTGRDGPSWRRSCSTQAKTLLACEVTHVDTVLLRRLYVFYVIEVATRRVHPRGVTRHPTGPWAVPCARDFATDLADRAEAVGFLVRDRDAKFTAVFDAVFASAGIEEFRTPVPAPRANAYAERWIGTLCRECLDRLLIVNERHLRLVLEQYVEHYNSHRPHRSLAQRSPDRRHDPERPANVHSLHLVQRQGVVGGLINDYNQAA
jgi:putative transposase